MLELVIATPDPLLPVEGPNALIVVVAPSNTIEREERRSMAAEGGILRWLLMNKQKIFSIRDFDQLIS